MKIFVAFSNKCMEKIENNEEIEKVLWKIIASFR